jgi:succinoglycan biosynthesis protein ExoV
LTGEAGMLLHYYKDPHGNFGDDLNTWLWERLLPGMWTPDGTVFCGVGTIFDDLIPPAPRTIVFSSGAGYSPPPKGLVAPQWDVVCVRGPMTVAALGLAPEKAVTDGACLLAALPDFKPMPEEARSGTIFIPHHEALGAGQWKTVCARAGIEFVSPCQDSRLVIGRIRSARLVIADAMHAAIVADTMRVPWVAVRTSPEISTFKWLDWTLSMGIPYEPADLPASSALEAARNVLLPFYGRRFALNDFSSEAVLAHYRALMRFKSSPRYPWTRNIVHALVYKRLVQHGRRTPGLRSVLDKGDEKRADRAAQVLLRAAGRSGFLSDGAIFRARLDELKHRLSLVRP